MSGFNVDDWVGVEEGLGQVIACYDVHVEEFLSDFRAGRQVGEFLNTLVLYKVLCGHDGNARKRFLTTYASSAGVSAMSEAHVGLVKRIREDKPKIFKSFVDYRRKTPISSNYTAWLDVPEKEVEAIAARVTEFKQTGPDAFTYPELMGYVTSEFPSLDVTMMHRGYSRTRNNLGLVLFNTNLQRKGKRALFTGVNVFIK